MLALVSAAYADGDHGRAESVARDITNPRSRAEGLVTVAIGLHRTDHDHAVGLAVEVEALARRSCDDPDSTEA